MTLDRRLFYVYVLATITFLFNLHFVLEETKRGFGLPDGEILIYVASGINLILLIYTVYCYKEKYRCSGIKKL